MLFLYLRKSFRRQAGRHFSLFLVLMCAFMLPLLVSIYRDSMMHGTYLQTLTFTSGQAVHITGIKSEDVEALRGIDGLTEPYYLGGCIYMNFATEEVWEQYSSASERGKLYREIISRLTQDGRDADAIQVNFYLQRAEEGVTDDPLLLTRWRQLLILSLALSLLAGGIVLSAYRNHIAAFDSEIGELSALGATRGQIAGMFLLEFAILFPLAVGGAIGISYAVMRVLYRQFLEQTTGSNVVWRVFRMDVENTALQVGFYMAVCLAALGFALRKKPGQRAIPQPKSTPSSLTRLWTQRTKPPFIQCLLILIPLVAAFVVLFNRYLGSYSQALQNAQSVEISVYTYNPALGFQQEELDWISAQKGVRKVEAVQEHINTYDVYAPNMDYLPGLCRVYAYQDYAPGEPDLGKYELVANFPRDFIMEGSYTIYNRSHYNGKTKLTLADRTLPTLPEGGGVSLFISRELMAELEAKAPVTQVRVYTTQAYTASLELTLKSGLPAGCIFSNSGTDDTASAALSEGHLWLLSWIFCILMVVAMQIVSVRLSSYVRECTPMLRTVRCVGASRRQLTRMIPAWQAAIPAATVPFLIAVAYTYARTRVLTQAWKWDIFIVSGPLLAIYAAIAAVAALTFLLPVRYSLGRMYQKPKE